MGIYIKTYAQLVYDLEVIVAPNFTKVLGKAPAILNISKILVSMISATGFS